MEGLRDLGSWSIALERAIHAMTAGQGSVTIAIKYLARNPGLKDVVAKRGFIRECRRALEARIVVICVEVVVVFMITGGGLGRKGVGRWGEGVKGMICWLRKRK